MHLNEEIQREPHFETVPGSPFQPLTGTEMEPISYGADYTIRQILPSVLKR